MGDGSAGGSGVHCKAGLGAGEGAGHQWPLGAIEDGRQRGILEALQIRVERD